MSNVEFSGQNQYNNQSTNIMNRSIYKKPLLLTLVFVGLLVVLYLVSGLTGGDDNMSSYIDSDMYQAVFMANGEVYFGAMTEANDDFLVLEDIYYLRVTPNLQQVTDPETGQVATAEAGEPQINLIKLGEELHGPEDRMVAPMTSVIYWENIEADGQVVQAIEAAKAEGAAEQPAAAQPQQPAAQQPAAVPQAQQPAAAEAPVEDDAELIE